MINEAVAKEHPKSVRDELRAERLAARRAAEAAAAADAKREAEAAAAADGEGKTRVLFGSDADFRREQEARGFFAEEDIIRLGLADVNSDGDAVGAKGRLRKLHANVPASATSYRHGHDAHAWSIDTNVKFVSSVGARVARANRTAAPKRVERV